MSENVDWSNDSFKVFEKPLKESQSRFLFSSQPFNVEAKTFIPSQPSLQSFDPFDTTHDPLDDDETIDDLGQRLISSDLLDEEEAVPLDSSDALYNTNTFVPQWNTHDNWDQKGLKHIWNNATTVDDDDHRQEQTAASTSKDKRTRHYSEDEQDFDPTLHFYHGTLYDAATIQDMNRLSLNVTNPSLEETQKENVEEDMSTLQMLQTIFSDLSDEELMNTLEKYDYDVDRAIEALLAQKLPVEVASSIQPITTSAQTTATITANNMNDDGSIPKKRQVCRHFLAGECYRKDCWFSHDLQEKVCKFWLQGSCLKGDSCEFLHKIDIEEVASKMTLPEIKPKKEEIKLDENDYPALKPAYSNHIVSHYSSSSSSSSMSQPSTTGIEEEFPTLASAAKMKKSSQPIGYRSGSKEPVNFAEAAKKNKGRLMNNKLKSTYAANHTQKRAHKYSMQQLRQPVLIPWLETGSSLNSTYMKEREKAIEYGMLRNRFFSKATEYYLKGDGARAKLFSMEAKHYNRLMQEMHKEASRRIFEQRSTHEAFIDLHGLHEDEAMDIVYERLEQLKQTYHGIIYIVTGTGHHSGASGLSKKQSKLKPTVYNYLKQENYRFAETSIMGDNQGGIFAVEI
ncbi:MAG: hypothetical protein EXX96DRAFT_566197 [Benjaminiella poitrasii]|nr:MAG: hypothetical protein EXX96DRAFT_566197 [Benjaminiella poitrasii]